MVAENVHTKMTRAKVILQNKIQNDLEGSAFSSYIPWAGPKICEIIIMQKKV
jgi:hypothetical protein